MKKAMMGAAAALFAMATTAGAVTLNIENGTSGVIPGGAAVNDFLDDLGWANPTGGYYGSQISLSDFANGGVLQVSVLGFEAGFRNSFTGLGGSYTSTGGTVFSDPLAAWTYTPTGDGLLDFMFSSVTSTGAPVGSVVNGSANAASDRVNFFATFGPGMEVATSGSVLWLFLDDSGSGPDDNHDDLVIRIAAVPLPAGGLMLLTGLGVLALRRKRKAA